MSLTNFLNYVFVCLNNGQAVIGNTANFIMAWCLCTSVVLAGAFYALEGQDGMGALIRRVFAIGVIIYLYREWAAWAVVIQDGFLSIGQKMIPGAFTKANFLHPNDIWERGRFLILKLIQNNTFLSLNPFQLVMNAAHFLIVLFVAVPIVMFAFLQAGISAMLVMVGMKLVVTFGVLLIPFNLLPATEFIGQHVFSKLISTGMKLGVTYVCIGIGYNYFADPKYALPTDPSLEQTLDLIGVAMAFGALVRFAPDFIAGFVAGAPSVSQLLQKR